MDQNSTPVHSVCAAAEQGTLSHAMILSGAGDRRGAARFVAAAHLCRSTLRRPCLTCNACRKVMEGIHPDVRIVEDSEHKELPAETIRALRQDAYIRPNESERKVYIFPDCAQLNERDQNILLKTLEEGPPYAAFIFCTLSAHALLPTVRSRCVELKLHGEEDGGDSTAALELCRIIAGRSKTELIGCLVGLENRKVKREQLCETLQLAWAMAAEALTVQRGKRVPDASLAEGVLPLAKCLQPRRLAKLVEILAYYAAECRYNVGVGHVLGGLAADLEEIL